MKPRVSESEGADGLGDLVGTSLSCRFRPPTSQPEAQAAKGEDHDRNLKREVGNGSAVIEGLRGVDPSAPLIRKLLKDQQGSGSRVQTADPTGSKPGIRSGYKAVRLPAAPQAAASPAETKGNDGADASPGFMERTLKRGWHRQTLRGQELLQERQTRQPVLMHLLAKNLNNPNKPVKTEPMTRDTYFNQCYVPPFVEAEGGTIPMQELKDWNPPYHHGHDWRWGLQDKSKAASHPVLEPQGDAALEAEPNGLDQRRKRTTTKSPDGRQWYDNLEARTSYAYFDTPLWSRERREWKTPSWMAAPNEMAQSSVWESWPKTADVRKSLEESRKHPVSRSSSTLSNADTSSTIDPRHLRSMDNRELRHFLSRSQVWSVEPIATAPRDELIRLARLHMSDVSRELKKAEVFKDIKRFPRPASITDKYRIQHRREEKAANEARRAEMKSRMTNSQSLPSSRTVSRAARTGTAEDPEEIIREVEEARKELEKSIAAVEAAKQKSEQAKEKLSRIGGGGMSRLQTGISAADSSRPSTQFSEPFTRRSKRADLYVLEDEESLENQGQSRQLSVMDPETQERVKTQSRNPDHPGVSRAGRSRRGEGSGRSHSSLC